MSSIATTTIDTKTTTTAKSGLPTFTKKNILITGGAGFIGSHAVILFVTKYKDYNIINVDKLDYCSSLVNLSEITHLKNYKFIKGDICSPDLMNHIFKTHQVDTVIHFAAQTHVDNSFGNSFSFTRNNVMGTHVLLEAAVSILFSYCFYVVKYLQFCRRTCKVRCGVTSFSIISLSYL